MSLVEDRIEISASDVIDPNRGMEKWRHFPASVISHHGAACCDIAREWFLATDYSQLNAGNPLTGPRWLRQKFTWGPSRHPIHWCEAVERKTLDCGALAALAHEVFLERGVKSFPAQLIQQYSEHAIRHWRREWDREEVSTHWIDEDVIYHEGGAVLVRGDEIKIWDATASWWVNPRQLGGYGGLLAIRVFGTANDTAAAFTWGAQRVIPNNWHRVERARGDLA